MADVLRFHIAGFAARTAIVVAVFAQAGVVRALAQAAVADTITLLLSVVTDRADKLLGHRRRLARFFSYGNDTIVLRPAEKSLDFREGTAPELTPVKRG